MSNKAPAVIIPIEHQSAPNLAQYRFEQHNVMPRAAGHVVHRHEDGRFAKTLRGGYDTEMDLPEYKDPRVQAAVDRFEERTLSRSPQQTVEEMLRLFEKNYRAAEKFRWNGQERWMGRENEAMRLVRFLHPEEFIRSLAAGGVDARSINPEVEKAMAAGREPRRTPGQPRVWLNSWVAPIVVRGNDGVERKISSGRVGVNAWLKDADTGRMVARTVTTVQEPYGPEYSLMRFDEWDVPTNERFRGWRTALLTLVIAGVVSEQEAHLAFGPANGPAGLFYREQLFNHRAMRLGIQRSA